MPGREILFEFRRIGNSVKVTALDAASNTEVSITGPATASRQQLEKAALAKLLHMLEKNASSAKNAASGDRPEPGKVIRSPFLARLR